MLCECFRSMQNDHCVLKISFSYYQKVLVVTYSVTVPFVGKVVFLYLRSKSNESFLKNEEGNND